MLLPRHFAILCFALNPNTGMVQYSHQMTFPPSCFALNPNTGMVQSASYRTCPHPSFALNPNTGMVQFNFLMAVAR